MADEPQRPLRVALVSDAWGSSERGNGTTVERWRLLCPEIIQPVRTGDPPPEGPPPDLVHGYHVIRGGLAARRLASHYGCPLVMSLGGTDLAAVALGLPERLAVLSALDGVAVLTGAFPSFEAPFQGQVPFITVPRSIPCPSEVGPLRAPDGTIRALLVAGLRPVKDVLYAIELARTLRSHGLPIRLTILGARSDEAYAQQVDQSLRGLEGIHLLRNVPHHQMELVYRSHDVLWNTSLHEGGANAILEAVSFGLPVFLRSVLGNRDYFLPHSPPGLLFDGDLTSALHFHSSLLTLTAAER
ncbi:MAG TPA: glycosyltransferase, partial [Planctomycetota bacterium]|nr:glycosyltransferase [Planctomycetota bacterium]